MRTLTAVLLSFATLAGGAGAQVTFTSPKGYGTVEGNGKLGHVLGATDGLRFQQLDATSRGTAVASLKSIAFRRDGMLATNTSYGARTLAQVGVVMAHTTLATISTTFAANYQGAATTVFTPKTVNAPDWSAKPATAPAPFDFKLLFDVNWSYNGTDDLLWEVGVGSTSVVPATVVAYPFDFQSATGSFQTSSDGVAFGSGCIAKGQTSRQFWLATSAYDRATSLALRHSVNFAPAGSAIYTFLDVADANLAVPGLCAPLRATPLVVLPLGTASSGGSVGSAYVEGIPFVAAAVGGSVYLQAIGLDDSRPGIQVAVSQGERLTIPGVPSLPSVGVVWGYATLSGTAIGGPTPGGVIAQLES